MSREVLIRLFAILLAMAQPIIILMYFGSDIKSISSVWGTPLQPLFIITNAITSFVLYEHKRWIPSAMFLLLLTAFSMDMFPILHNWLAYGFFVSCLIPMFDKERYAIYPVLLLCSLVFWIRKGFFWMEFWAIYVICAYHLKLLYIRYQYEKRNQ